MFARRVLRTADIGYLQELINNVLVDSKQNVPQNQLTKPDELIDLLKNDKYSITEATAYMYKTECIQHIYSLIYAIHRLRQYR